MEPTYGPTYGPRVVDRVGPPGAPGFIGPRGDSVSNRVVISVVTLLQPIS